MTMANEHEAAVFPELMTKAEEVIHRDNGYVSAERGKEAVTRNSEGKTC